MCGSAWTRRVTPIDRPVRSRTGREPGLVAVDLRAHCCQDVDSADVSEPDQVDRHVSDLVSEAPQRLRVEQVLRYTVVGHPLELCGQFPRFAA